MKIVICRSDMVKKVCQVYINILERKENEGD